MPKLDWSELIEETEEVSSGRSSSLGRTTPSGEHSEPQANAPKVREPYDISLLITYNYPDTMAFRNAKSQEQKKIYSKLFFNTKNFNGLIPYNEEFVFEYCDSGRVHLHGLLQYKINHDFHINGLVADFAKGVLEHLPKKYSQYLPKALHTEYNRYKVSSMCIQYKRTDDPYIKDTWVPYMAKQQNLK